MKTTEVEKMRKDLKKITDKIESGNITELEIVNAMTKSSKNLKKNNKGAGKSI